MAKSKQDEDHIPYCPRENVPIRFGAVHKGECSIYLITTIPEIWELLIVHPNDVTLPISSAYNLQVGDVKATIEAEQGVEFPKDATNIIFQGKILKDDATLEESKLTETGFCVIMAMKVRYGHRINALNP